MKMILQPTRNMKKLKPNSGHGERTDGNRQTGLFADEVGDKVWGQEM